MKKILTICAIHLSATFLFGQTIYVSPTGNAANSGTDINNPTTLANAIASATTSGVTIYLRGGTYTLSTTHSITYAVSGTAGAYKNLHAYPSDATRPLLDFSAMAVTSSNRGVAVQASYWHIKGIDIYKAGDNGMYLSGSNNIIENCSFFENSDTGLQLGNSSATISGVTTYFLAANNQIINCDSYYNADPAQGNADGFAVKLSVGTGNSFTGCRAWQNSDDGWDGYMRPDAATGATDDVTTTLNNCWAFKNGYLKSGAVATSGNGNGFKVGGSDLKDMRHNMTLTNCLSFENTADGFDQNSNLGNMTFLNCTGWNNKRNYGLNDRALATGKLLTLKNCISHTTTSSNSFLSAAVQATNSWSSGFSVANADFQSIVSTAAYGARQADGSLPDMTFMHLASTSSLINRGTNVGLAFNGSAPDLGAFETGSVAPVTLSSFSAQKQGENVLLKWETASESNNQGWSIERSIPPQYNWEKIGFVKGNGTTNTPQYYTFLDEKPLIQTTYYRLQQTDFDGKITASKIVSIENHTDKTLKINAFPNPTTDGLTVKFEVTQTKLVQLAVLNHLGQNVLTLPIKSYEIGTQQTVIPTTTLKQGSYFLEYRAGQERCLLPFVVIKN